MTTQVAEQSPVVKILALLNQLSLAAFKCKKKQALIFQMLNDTVQLAPYDRAVLWEIQGSTPKLLGVSGQSQVNKNSGLAELWQRSIKNLKDSYSIQTLSRDSFKEGNDSWQEVSQHKNQPSIQWLPIVVNKDLVLGLWLERWEAKPWSPGEIDILTFLIQAYAAAWEKFVPKITIRKITRRQTFFLFVVIFCLLFLVHIPLRIVAPCEVVPKEPTLVTAPLDGIIADMIVKPGDYVTMDQILFKYDRRIPEQEYKVAQKQVQITQSELNRATTLAFQDHRHLSEVATLRLSLQKENLSLDLAQYQVERLNVFAPQLGVVMLDDPDQWKGKPVVVGERILKISDPDMTQVRVWLPEGDNVELDYGKDVKIILNVAPESTLYARLNYIADFSEVNDTGVPSFVAEADWVNEDFDAKMGLKGTAILYGEEVPLFYWIIRRPWATLRGLIGF